jgi:hypothetical protein
MFHMRFATRRSYSALRETDVQPIDTSGRQHPADEPHGVDIVSDRNEGKLLPGCISKLPMPILALDAGGRVHSTGRSGRADTGIRH